MIATLETRKQWRKVFKILKENDCYCEILYLTKPSPCMIVGKKNTFRITSFQNSYLSSILSQEARVWSVNQREEAVDTGSSISPMGVVTGISRVLMMGIYKDSQCNLVQIITPLGRICREIKLVEHVMSAHLEGRQRAKIQFCSVQSLSRVRLFATP